MTEIATPHVDTLVIGEVEPRMVEAGYTHWHLGGEAKLVALAGSVSALDVADVLSEAKPNRAARRRAARSRLVDQVRRHELDVEATLRLDPLPVDTLGAGLPPAEFDEEGYAVVCKHCWRQMLAEMLARTAADDLVSIVSVISP
jgi:hypothetical protein